MLKGIPRTDFIQLATLFAIAGNAVHHADDDDARKRAAVHAKKLAIALADELELEDDAPRPDDKADAPEPDVRSKLNKPEDGASNEEDAPPAPPKPSDAQPLRDSIVGVLKTLAGGQPITLAQVMDGCIQIGVPPKVATRKATLAALEALEAEGVVVQSKDEKGSYWRTT